MKQVIEKSSYNGSGITHINGVVTFVKKALPEEKVEIEVTKSLKTFKLAKVVNFINPSKIRQDSYCPYSQECGGCSYDFMRYENALIVKQNALNDLLTHHHLPRVNEIVKSDKSLEYRNKISLKVVSKEFGYYESDSHLFVPIKDCFLASKTIREFLKDFALLNLDNGTLTIRVNYNDELLLIVETEEKPSILESIISKHKIAGIIWNNKCIYNSPYFIEKRKDLLYKVNYPAFFQVNSYIAEEISTEILKEFNDHDRVYDLYCGVGYFSLKIAQKVKEVVGIEENVAAVIDAHYNASLNNISNVTFHAGKVENLIHKISFSPDKVVVDPPRSGIDKRVIQELLNKEVNTIIYVSCNPLTLVRDIGLLSTKYAVIFIKAYDMFPYTYHVESVAVIKLKDKL